MSPSAERFLASVIALCREQVRQAGQRYTPGIDPQAPNLRVDALSIAIENVACGSNAQGRFQGIVDDLSEAWSQASHCSQQRETIQALIDDTSESLTTIMTRLRARDPRAEEEWITRLVDLETHLRADITHWRAEEEKRPPSPSSTTASNTYESIRGNLNALGRCLAIVREEKEFSETPAFKALIRPYLLISGEWGTGKTHLLCDTAETRIQHNQITILALAKNFQGQVLTEICTQIEPGRSLEWILNQLQEMSDKLRERSLIIIDGINEGQRKEWRQAVTKLLTLIKDYPGVGLIISCRTPFESISLTKEALSSLQKVRHFGFDDQEFDAQAAFFQYYRLPLPEVPLLDEEFSRPLTLKLICQSLQNLSSKKQSKGFSGIASGQKGMTYVFESLVNRIGKPIEEKYQLKPKGCWWLLKGDKLIQNRKYAGFAPCMAANLRGFVRPSEADRIIAANYPSLSPSHRRDLLESLRTNGIIEEDIIWYKSSSGIKSRIVFRLPYQRFSDHLIARCLLEENLEVSSQRAIKKSLSEDSPLGRIFKISGSYQHRYTEPGWVQALITEFPNRVRKRVPAKYRELFFALPHKAQSLSAYFEPFIEGLFWRDPASFTEGTRSILNQYLHADKETWERVVDALAAVSTKPHHPYHARRLYDFIAQYSITERDLRWTEYLRREHASPTIRRLLAWANNLDAASMTQSSAHELIILFSLILTTIVRSDRDLATKALVVIGEKFPETLFKHTLTSLAFNDPYVSERLLAAAYGVTLSQVDAKSSSAFRALLGKFAKTIYKQMFAPGARYSTHHTLKRDYALGIIQVSQKANCVTLPKTAARNLSAPYPQTISTFSGDGTPDPTVTEAIGHAIRMDFGNYTLGRLIPSRPNYDYKHPEYIKVRAHIERRIFELGYRKEQFEAIEREIGNMSFHSRHENTIDRYGKKYSWIAYFEMWGEREAKKSLPGWRLGERIQDCGIDPSFPKQPPEWIPPIPDLFNSAEVNTEIWVASNFTPEWQPLLEVQDINGHKNKWILLEGYIYGADENHDRELFAFLRGAFVSKKDIDKLRTRFMKIKHPGNSTIPDPSTVHLLFAGEAGRRNNFAPHLLEQDGKYRRQMVEAFDEYITLEKKNRVSTTTIKVNYTGPTGEQQGQSLTLHGTDKDMHHIRGIQIELPTISFEWGSHHSILNTVSSFFLPAPRLIQTFNLASKDREIDFYDKTGRPGTLYREAGNDWRGRQHRLLYIRADLLREYLADTMQELVWFNWGERDWLKKMEDYELIETTTRSRIYRTNRNVHKSFVHWQG